MVGLPLGRKHLGTIASPPHASVTKFPLSWCPGSADSPRKRRAQATVGTRDKKCNVDWCHNQHWSRCGACSFPPFHQWCTQQVFRVCYEGRVWKGRAWFLPSQNRKSRQSRKTNQIPRSAEASTGQSPLIFRRVWKGTTNSSHWEVADLFPENYQGSLIAFKIRRNQTAPLGATKSVKENVQGEPSNLDNDHWSEESFYISPNFHLAFFSLVFFYLIGRFRSKVVKNTDNSLKNVSAYKKCLFHSIKSYWAFPFSDETGKVQCYQNQCARVCRLWCNLFGCTRWSESNQLKKLLAHVRTAWKIFAKKSLFFKHEQLK